MFIQSLDADAPGGGARRWPVPLEREYQFGPFRFIPARQWLACGDTPLRIGCRALDILAALLERPGELVTKRELIARVWPSTVVEESNLKVQLSALRRALGEGEDGRRYVATVNGRGYRFVSPVTCMLTGKPDEPAVADPAPPSLQHLPSPTVRAIGREDAISTLLEVLAQRRVATVAGPAGIGKTTVALALADVLAGRSQEAICFVDLGPVGEPACVAAALGEALGLACPGADPVDALLDGLRGRRLLLILDSCERVLDASAVLVELIAAQAPGVSVLATSREPLRVPGECVYRLPPLASPPPELPLTAAEALRFSAVRLFAERAAESVEGYRLSDADAPAVAEICRRMEGLPLAIELAALRMDALGARELASRLDERLRLLARGRRSILPRHRTLAAALDWSYELLPAEEQALLRGLAVFAGPFTLDAAVALFAGGPVDAGHVVDGVANLVEKSLLSADLGGMVVRYRLLATTRACAFEKLEACGEAPLLRRRHAELQCGMAERLPVTASIHLP